MPSSEVLTRHRLDDCSWSPWSRSRETLARNLRPGEHRFARSRHVLDQDVTLTKQGHHKQFDLSPFTYDDGLGIAGDGVGVLGYPN